MIINTLGGPERHLSNLDNMVRVVRPTELIVRKQRRSFRLNTVAFFSSRIEKTDKRL